MFGAFKDQTTREVAEAIKTEIYTISTLELPGMTSANFQEV